MGLCITNPRELVDYSVSSHSSKTAISANGRYHYNAYFERSGSTYQVYLATRDISAISSPFVFAAFLSWDTARQNALQLYTIKEMGL